MADQAYRQEKLEELEPVVPRPEMMANLDPYWHHSYYDVNTLPPLVPSNNSNNDHHIHIGRVPRQQYLQRTIRKARGAQEEEETPLKKASRQKTTKQFNLAMTFFLTLCFLATKAYFALGFTFFVQAYPQFDEVHSKGNQQLWISCMVASSLYMLASILGSCIWSVEQEKQEKPKKHYQRLVWSSLCVLSLCCLCSTLLCVWLYTLGIRQDWRTSWWSVRLQQRIGLPLPFPIPTSSPEHKFMAQVVFPIISIFWSILLLVWLGFWCSLRRAWLAQGLTDEMERRHA